MLHVDPSHWRELSALLDQALDLDPAGRAASVASVRDRRLASRPPSTISWPNTTRPRRGAFSKRTLTRPTCRSPATVRRSARTRWSPLGAGGMGTVWLGRRSDGRFQGQVAIKLLNLALLDSTGQERFRREGTVLARLSHPNIARLLDAGVSASGQPYLVLEFIDGQPIDVSADAHRQSIAERLRLIPRRACGRRSRPRQPDRSPRSQALEHSRQRRRRSKAPRFRNRQAAGTRESRTARGASHGTGARSRPISRRRSRFEAAQSRWRRMSTRWECCST